MPEPDPTPPRRTHAGVFLVGSALVVVALAFGVLYFALFTRPEARPEAPPPPPPLSLTIATLEGPVEVFRAGAWAPAAAGSRLAASDRVRTGAGARATLRLSDGSTVSLEPMTETQVQALDRALSRIRLGAGLVQADIADDPGRLFQVDLDDDGAAARTHGAAFAITSNGAGGAAAVSASRGQVTVAARGREVVIRSGEITRVAPGAAPTAPEPLPAALLLKVAWPQRPLHAPSAVVEGETEPAARLEVQGRPTPVGADGRYRVVVALREGENRVTVRARLAGAPTREERSPPITVDTRTDFKVQIPRWK
ncbi:MAG TPA: FecR family protein [Polyangia bacterium]